MKIVPEILKELSIDNPNNADEVLKLYQKAVKEGNIVPKMINMKGKDFDVFEEFYKAMKTGFIRNHSNGFGNTSNS